MTRAIALPRAARGILILCVLATSSALSACGGGGSTAGLSPPPPSGGGSPPPPPAPVEGVATPTSVAVVTATNAQ